MEPLHYFGLVPGEARFVSCTNEKCVTGVAGMCLYCEQPWARCGCHKMDFDCECGRCAERADDYLPQRVAALEMAIIKHRKTTGKEASEADLALYKVFDDT